MNHYFNLKEYIVSSVLNKFTQIDGTETEAIVTHWLQNTNGKVPYLTDSLREFFYESAKEHLKEKDTLLVSERKGKDQLNFVFENIPYPPIESPSFTFIDLFAGIGGFRLAMQSHGGKCVFSSEWDPSAKKTYEANFGEVPFGDIKKIHEDEIPDHDILCAGFPCQPFSLAGVSARNSLNLSHGFACETQGTLFFDIARIINKKRPRAVFLENVKNIVNHDNGVTFSVIKNTIKDLGYSFQYKIIDSSPLVPQKRVRCYMVCFRDNKTEFEFPKITGEPLPLKSILEDYVDDSFTISDKLWQGHINRTERNLQRGTGFTAFFADLNKPSNTIVARYGKDGKECLIPQVDLNPRMLTPRECARLQGFPENYIIPVAKTTAYRQFGNSVALPVVSLIGKSILNSLNL